MAVAHDAESLDSIVDDVSNLVAKVDSRSFTKTGDTIEVALDVIHCHLFDKETEMTILNRDLSIAAPSQLPVTEAPETIKPIKE